MDTQRTKNFCLDVINLSKDLPNSYLGRYIANQLTRAGCSVASNHRASRLAQSKAAFIAKISIVIEESDECAFWCEIIAHENLTKDSILEKVRKEANEIASVFIASRKTIQASG